MRIQRFIGLLRQPVRVRHNPTTPRLKTSADCGYSFPHHYIYAGIAEKLHLVAVCVVSAVSRWGTTIKKPPPGLSATGEAVAVENKRGTVGCGLSIPVSRYRG